MYNFSNVKLDMKNIKEIPYTTLVSQHILVLITTVMSAEGLMVVKMKIIILKGL
jgi:hypothetical protein